MSSMHWLRIAAWAVAGTSCLSLGVAAADVGGARGWVPLGLVPSFPAAAVVVVVVLAALGELAGVAALAVGASRRYDGPMGKSDRALLFGVLGLWTGIGGPLPDWSVLIMPVTAALLAATTINRIRAGLYEGRGSQ